MDTSLTLTPKAVAAIPVIPEAQRPSDTKVPVIKSLDGAATLPSDKAFVAQVVTARLSGTAFPENPAEIAPPDRTLRPYDIPMLPSNEEEPPATEAEAEGDVEATEPEVTPEANPVEANEALPVGETVETAQTGEARTTDTAVPEDTSA